MKKSSIILFIAAILLGVMYWQKPKPPVPQPESQSKQLERSATTSAKPPPTMEPRKPRKAPATNRVQQAHSTEVPKPPQPVLIESLPVHLKGLIQYPKHLPGPAVIAQLSAKDQPVLVQLYQQTTNLADRKALTMALGLIGNEEVVVLFKNALTLEHAGKTLTSGYPGKTDEEYTLFNTVVALGFLAAKYDSAYDFVKKGTDPWFWRDQIQWTSSRGSETEGMLTSYGIQAIGMSGRSDAPRILEQLKSKDMVNRVDGDSLGARNFSGDVVQAAFYYDVIQQYGMDALRNNIFTENRMKLFLQWKATENGKKWDAWDQTAKRQR